MVTARSTVGPIGQGQSKALDDILTGCHISQKEVSVLIGHRPVPRRFDLSVFLDPAQHGHLNPGPADLGFIAEIVTLKEDRAHNQKAPIIRRRFQ